MNTMHIDNNCDEDNVFINIINKLPEYFKSLDELIRNKVYIEMNTFYQKSMRETYQEINRVHSGKNEYHKEFTSDFKGLYVLFTKDESNNLFDPIYVGISGASKNTGELKGGVIKRLRQHVCDPTINSTTRASLATRIAKQRADITMLYINDTKYKKSNWDKFVPEFHKAINEIRAMYVTFIKVEDDMLLYLLEPYISLKLRTTLEYGKYNSFSNH